MCVPPIVIGILAGGLGFIQNQMMVAAQNEAIEIQNINQAGQFERDKIQVEAQRFNQQQQYDSTQLANETSEYLANRALEKETQSINLQIAQAQEEAALKKQEKWKEVTRAKGEILATGKGGINIFNLLADVDSQYGQFDYAVNRNLAFTGSIADQDKRSANIRRASRLATLNPYIKQTYIDPVRPVDAPKIRSNTGLALLSAGLQGASAGMAWHSGMLDAGYKWEGGRYHKVGSTGGSSRLLKENIFKLGKSSEGHNVYKFNYKNNPTNYIGVIAEEVQKIKPEAVFKMANGFLGVNYDLIDVDFLVQTT